MHANNEAVDSGCIVGPMFSGLLPVRSDQEVLFGQLVRSISLCERLACLAWSIRLLDGGFVLRVGGHEAMTAMAYPHAPQRSMHSNPAQVLVLVQLALAGAEPEHMADLSVGSCIERMRDDAWPAPLWRYSGSFVATSERGTSPTKAQLTADLRRLAPAHRLFLQQASESVGATRARSAGPDTAWVYSYAWQICGQRYSRKGWHAQPGRVAGTSRRRGSQA